MSALGPRATIFGCSGPVLTPGEAWFFRESQPWGFILFARNCHSRDQVKDLVRSLRAAVGREEAPVLIDQEGGRVQRLKPPEWPDYPAAERLGTLYAQNAPMAREAVGLHARLLAHELRALGITVDCVPVVDVPTPEEHGIIGDRAYGRTAAQVGDLAAVAAQQLLRDGVLPVIKHLPGHGRARSDSHESLPLVDAPRAALEDQDFAAFKAVRDMPLGMTAHVVYEAIDAQAPATWSSVVIEEVIRGFIGFDGLLMSDDLSMGALDGPFGERTERAIRAGCDVVLHCNGAMSEMVEIAATAPPLDGRARERAERALSLLAESQPESFDPGDAWAKLGALTDSSA